MLRYFKAPHMSSLCYIYIYSDLNVETTQLSLSLKVLEIAAMRVGFLEKACHSIQEVLTQALSAEYYMLRIILVTSLPKYSPSSIYLKRAN